MARRRWVALILLVGGALAVTGGPARAATGDVEIDNSAFSPATIRINPGDRVQWTNKEDTTHRVVSDDGSAEHWDSGDLDKDENYSHTFDEPGTFTYHCRRHPEMKGVVEVGAPATTTSSSTTTTTEPPTTTTEPPTTTTEPPTTTTTAVTSPPSTSPAVASAPPRATTTSTAAPSTSSSTTSTSSSTTSTTTTSTTTTTTSPSSTSTTAEPPTHTTTPPPPSTAPPRQRQSAAGRVKDVGGSGLDFGLLLGWGAVIGAGGFAVAALWMTRPGAV